MKKFFAVTLGILTAIGGFVDVGDLVASSLSGARFGLALAWVVVVGVVGICAYAEMCGRVVAISNRPVFDLVRERLGARVSLLNLVASYLVNLLTLGAELGGVALALQLATSVSYLLWVPVAAFVLWVVLWRVKFETLERVFGLLGLTLVIFAVAVFRLPGHGPELWHQALSPVPTHGENWNTYGYFAISLFASAMTPYEVFFFSSGGVEEKWGPRELSEMRSNVFVGFPLGGGSARSRCPPRSPSASSAWRWRSSRCSRSPSGPPWRPGCPRRTWSPSTSAGPGASWCRPGAPPGSTPCCWSASWSAPPCC